MSIWRRFFPESLFPRRLDEGAERRMRLAQAKAEEAIIDAHVRNTLMFIDTLAEDMAFDRAIDTYVRVMGVPEPLAGIVATRVLVELGEELVPRRVLRPKPDRTTEQQFSDELDDAGDRPAVRIRGSELRQGAPARDRAAARFDPHRSIAVNLRLVTAAATTTYITSPSSGPCHLTEWARRGWPWPRRGQCPRTP
jgi:hypothetical protein